MSISEIIPLFCLSFSISAKGSSKALSFSASSESVHLLHPTHLLPKPSWHHLSPDCCHSPQRPASLQPFSLLYNRLSYRGQPFFQNAALTMSYSHTPSISQVHYCSKKKWQDPQYSLHWLDWDSLPLLRLHFVPHLLANTHKLCVPATLIFFQFLEYKCCLPPYHFPLYNSPFHTQISSRWLLHICQISSHSEVTPSPPLPPANIFSQRQALSSRAVPWWWVYLCVTGSHQSLPLNCQLQEESDSLTHQWEM